MAWPSDLVRTKNWGTEILTDADLEGQFDLIIAWLMAAFNSSTGHDHSGSSNKGPKIPFGSLTIASQAQGDIIYYNGTAWTRLGAGTSGRFLQTQGAAANPQWAALTASSLPNGSVVQVVHTQTGAYASGTTTIPDDDTIPQNTEGDEYMTLAITPTSATSILVIQSMGIFDNTTADVIIGALFQDTTANALSATRTNMPENEVGYVLPVVHKMVSGTTSSTTFKYRAGAANTGTMEFNGDGGARKLGGVMGSYITIWEVKAS